MALQRHIHYPWLLAVCYFALILPLAYGNNRNSLPLLIHADHMLLSFCFARSNSSRVFTS
jgi:hypothetical protein